MYIGVLLSQILNVILFQFTIWFICNNVSYCCSVVYCNLITAQILTSSTQVDDEAPVEDRAASQSLGRRHRVDHLQTHTHLGTEPCTGSADQPVEEKRDKKQRLVKYSEMCV